jgi:Ribbon-helix-helix protein, copG family.
MKQVKVSDQLHEKLKELAEKRGVSINQLIEEILNVYLYGATGKTIKRVAVDKEIPALYPDKCSKCGRPINPGDHIRYIVYEYEDSTVSKVVLCSECSLGLNPNLWRLYMKKRELETIVKQLKAEADRLAREVSIRELALSVKNLLDVTYKIHSQKLEDSVALRKYLEILERLDQIADRLRALEVPPPQTKPKRPQYQRARY